MRKNQSAFTLLEIMLVVTIIAVLLGAAIYKLSGNVETGKMVAVQADIQSITTQLKLYETLNGFFPTTEQGLQALVTRRSSDPQPNRWTQFFESVPKDPWQNNYIYLNPGRKNPDGLRSLFRRSGSQTRHADDDWGNQ